jgi:hypothetical protein
MLLKDFKTNELAFVYQVVNSGKDLKKNELTGRFPLKISKQRG